jgi:copper chaperone
MESSRIRVDGMTCGGCVASVRRAVTALGGVSRVDASVADAVVTVDFDPRQTTLDAVKRAIEEAGFDVVK